MRLQDNKTTRISVGVWGRKKGVKE